MLELMVDDCEKGWLSQKRQGGERWKGGINQ